MGVPVEVFPPFAAGPVRLSCGGMEPAVFDFWERVHAICVRDPRFRREAYEFAMRGLEHTTQRVVGQRRHVSGQELLRGLIDLARHEFGDLAWAVLREWGVTRSEDFAGGLDLRVELEPPPRTRPHA